MEGMKYNTFNVWMNGKRKAKKSVKGHIIRVFDSFIRHNSGAGVIKGHNLVGIRAGNIGS